MMPLSIFGFRALWSPYFLTSVVLIIGVYYILTIKKRDRFEGSVPLTKGQHISFLSAMILLYIVKGSPVDLLGHILFSVHMAQMALLLLLVPPLLIRGIPNWLWKKVFDVAVLNRIIRFFTKPLLSLILFSGMFSIYHYPAVLDTIKLSLPLHSLFTFTLFMAAMFLWWPVVNTLEGQPKLHGLKKIGYIILSAILITPACSLIIFANNPMYETYVSGEAWLKSMALCVPGSTLAALPPISGPELFTKMKPVYDQQLGGIVMKMIQEIIYIVVIGKIFIDWYREERENADEITKKALMERQKLSMHGN